MIYYLNLENTYGPRPYLKQWFFDNILVITDLDIWKINQQNLDVEKLLHEHPCKNVVVDLSMNPNSHDIIPVALRDKTILSSGYCNWYNDQPSNIHYFPLFPLKFSLRDCAGWPAGAMDASGRKTQSVMCLNRSYHPHRRQLYQRLQPVIDKMCYTYDKIRLPDDKYWDNGEPAVDIGLDNKIYDEYAVNLVTESSVTIDFVSEKICKAFMARQIPILVGFKHVNQFMQDLGLDMFSDLVPWRWWDTELDEVKRVDQIADFVMHWVNSGTMLQDYAKVTDRIEKNKQWFHSSEFRDRLLKHMPQPNPY